MQLFLSFHNYTILVDGNERSVIEKLKEEFDYFSSNEALSPDLTVELKREGIPEIPSMVAHKILEHVTIYTLGDRVFYDYQSRALVIWDKARNQISLYTEDEDFMFELAFLAIHSNLGQQLDLAGFSRIHALGISYCGKNALIMLPSKGGKSTMLAELLENQEIKVISDDMPLIDQEGKVHPFPAKLGLSQKPVGHLASLKWNEFKRTHYPPKWVASLSQIPERIETQSQNQVTLLINGKRLSRGQGFIEQVSPWRMIAPIMEHMIIGIGLPQILEFFLAFRASDLLKLLKHAWRRAICAFQLLRKSPCFIIYLGPDIKDNCRLILETLNDSKSS